MNPLIADNFIPECEDDGIHFVEKQCHNGEWTACYCVDRVTGAMTHIGQTELGDHWDCSTTSTPSGVITFNFFVFHPTQNCCCSAFTFNINNLFWIYLATLQKDAGFSQHQCDKYQCWCQNSLTGEKDEESITPKGERMIFTCPDTRGITILLDL